MKFTNIRIRKKKLSIAEQGRIARRLSVFLSAGVPLHDALKLMKKPVFMTIAETVSKGFPCSRAFEASGLFDPSLIDMIRLGEQTGTLEQAYLRSAAELEARDALSRKIIGAMVYPAFIACATIGIAGFLIIYIFPKITPLFSGMGIPLPFLTKMLIGLSDILVRHWLAISISAAILFIAVRILWKYSAFARKIFRRGLLGVPFFGNIFRARIFVDMFRPLGILLEHGELMPGALISVAKSITHEEYSRLLSVSARSVTAGENIAAAFASSGRRLFPSLVTDFIEMGERAGGMAQACERIAHIYESEAEESIRRISQIIEPILMLGMGLIVGSIALSIVMPIYSITSHLSMTA